MIKGIVTFIFKFIYLKNCLTSTYRAFLCEKHCARCGRLKEKKQHNVGLGLITAFKRDWNEEGDTYEGLDKIEGWEGGC